MNEYNTSDIPATINFQNRLNLLQEEYRQAIKTGIHNDVKFYESRHTGALPFQEKCCVIYELKVKSLCWDIIDEHMNSEQSHIELINYKRFKELVWDALFKTHDFLEK